ncbi:slipin family protein [Chlorobium phaeovibrioides]|uniref:Slipin family protein n=2 Tax=Chlorobium phaeovibrioides TaxID=1094 RepID=A0A432AWX7_CHLPH|nr:slipin family protein [Chlorobium phaeovibrioides]HCD36950.1 slipin family protein [Chlorobium sp.]KAA6232725.1 slipin family protein [Chlorobium phaeovibrioides]MWV54861.1 slipin family protein [Chlorobium phaeovibrioides]QEQ56881.1 slipin family protein [Chlorobium phaeovibrioides]RTY37334.1 slipin family protein [Chlorobium phaeovibrioides]
MPDFNFFTILLLLVLFLGSSVKIMREYERAVVFRLGRLLGAKGPGIIILIPGIDKMIRVDLRTVTLDVPPQDIITRDNVSVKVSAVVYFRVVEPVNAIIDVEDFHFATSQLAQTTLRSVCGQGELDNLLAERDEINERIQSILAKDTEPWGVKVSKVEVKEIDLPEEMRRAMAKQAEAERERRSKIINAEGEFQAAQRLADAANVISSAPSALQLRYLQTLKDIAQENNSTTVFPIPIDLFSAFLDKGNRSSSSAT